MPTVYKVTRSQSLELQDGTVIELPEHVGTYGAEKQAAPGMYGMPPVTQPIATNPAAAQAALAQMQAGGQGNPAGASIPVDPQAAATQAGQQSAVPGLGGKAWNLAEFAGLAGGSMIGNAGGGMPVAAMQGMGGIKTARTKLAQLGPHEVVIDRPKGFEKTFKTQQGDMKVPYPVDYGYLKDVVNPDDDEDLDVFMGSGGPHHGRFMKGTDLSGKWAPDERKWYHGLTDEELQQVKHFFTQQSPELLQDFQQFPDEDSFLKDVAMAGKKREKQGSVASIVSLSRPRNAEELTEWLEKRSSHVRVRVAAGDGKHLLHHYVRAKQWDHPAGKVEAGEDSKQAAIRELLERTGYQGSRDDLEDDAADGSFAQYRIPLSKLTRTAKPGERGGYSTRVKVANVEELTEWLEKRAGGLPKLKPGAGKSALTDLMARLQGKPVPAVRQPLTAAQQQLAAKNLGTDVYTLRKPEILARPSVGLPVGQIVQPGTRPVQTVVPIARPAAPAPAPAALSAREQDYVRRDLQFAQHQQDWQRLKSDISDTAAAVKAAPGKALDAATTDITGGNSKATRAAVYGGLLVAPTVLAGQPWLQADGEERRSDTAGNKTEAASKAVAGRITDADVNDSRRAATAVVTDSVAPAKSLIAPPTVAATGSQLPQSDQQLIDKWMSQDQRRRVAPATGASNLAALSQSRDMNRAADLDAAKARDEFDRAEGSWQEPAITPPAFKPLVSKAPIAPAPAPAPVAPAPAPAPVAPAAPAPAPVAPAAPAAPATPTTPANPATKTPAAPSWQESLTNHITDPSILAALLGAGIGGIGDYMMTSDEDRKERSGLSSILPYLIGGGAGYYMLPDILKSLGVTSGGGGTEVKGSYQQKQAIALQPVANPKLPGFGKARPQQMQVPRRPAVLPGAVKPEAVIPVPPVMQKQSVFQQVMSGRQKQAFGMAELQPYLEHLKHPAVMGGLAGAGVGMLGSSLMGDDEDEHGRRRSSSASWMLPLLLGAGGAYAGHHYAPQIQEWMGGGAKKPLARPMQGPVNRPAATLPAGSEELTIPDNLVPAAATPVQPATGKRPDVTLPPMPAALTPKLPLGGRPDAPPLPDGQTMLPGADTERPAVKPVGGRQIDGDGINPDQLNPYGTTKVGSYAGNKSINVQQYSPQLNKRKFSADEEAAIAEGEDQWVPKIFQNYSTSVPDMMSSPGKGAVLGAMPGAVLGGSLGAHIGGAFKSPGTGGVLGALGGGGLTALLTYLKRDSDNAGLKDMMSRLPHNATKRDLLSDPAYQADLTRLAQQQQGSGVGQAAMLATLLGNSRNGYSHGV